MPSPPRADILLILAHPDDESFAGGGALAHYARRGLRTALLCYTDGQAGRLGRTGAAPIADRGTVGAVRRAELQRAAAILGIETVITPGWMDGALDRVSDERGLAVAVEQIRRFRPSVTISFGPEGAANGHADHIASSRWATRAFELAADRLHDDGLAPHEVAKHYWITWPPEADHLRNRSGEPFTTVLELDPAIPSLKLLAFEAHATQQDHLDIFMNYQGVLHGREYFHLARSRVGMPISEIEIDLLADLDNSHAGVVAEGDR